MTGGRIRKVGYAYLLLTQNQQDYRVHMFFLIFNIKITLSCSQHSAESPDSLQVWLRYLWYCKRQDGHASQPIYSRLRIYNDVICCSVFFFYSLSRRGRNFSGIWPLAWISGKGMESCVQNGRDTHATGTENGNNLPSKVGANKT